MHTCSVCDTPTQAARQMCGDACKCTDRYCPECLTNCLWNKYQQLSRKDPAIRCDYCREEVTDMLALGASSGGRGVQYKWTVGHEKLFWRQFVKNVQDKQEDLRKPVRPHVWLPCSP